MNNDNDRMLLIAQMERALVLLKRNVSPSSFYNKDGAELEAKLKEIRRDSIRFIKNARL